MGRQASRADDTTPRPVSSCLRDLQEAPFPRAGTGKSGHLGKVVPLSKVFCPLKFHKSVSTDLTLLGLLL